MRWEYCRLSAVSMSGVLLEFFKPGQAPETIKSTWGQIEQQIAELGLEGWEMVNFTLLYGQSLQPEPGRLESVVGEIYYFKRPLAD